MALLWVRNPTDGEPWLERPIEAHRRWRLGRAAGAEGRRIDARPAEPEAAEPEAAEPEAADLEAATLLRCCDGPGGRERWALLVPAGVRVRVNGWPVDSGLRLVRHEDEIVVSGSSPAYFSTERLPAAEPAPAEVVGLPCRRCHRALREGDGVVRCPRCGSYHHQIPAGEAGYADGLQCWSALPQCGVCGRRTDVDGYLFVPDRL